MKDFARLYAELDATTRTTAKVVALRSYFASARPEDAAWAIYFLVGRKPRQAVSSRLLRTWAAEAAAVPDWLFGESYDAVGDLAETIALILPPPEASSEEPLHVWVNRLLELRALDESQKRLVILDTWFQLDEGQRFVWNKLISGAFRVGVSQQLVTRALGEAFGLDPAVMAHRLMGDWEPSAAFIASLRQRDARDADPSRPYPFFLAHPIESAVETLGEPQDWAAEWKWDGIRAQLIRRQGGTFLWTRGEELVTERYPELVELGTLLPDGVALDGEILPWRDEGPMVFAQLQRRIGRKSVSRALLREVPVLLMAYDLIEEQGADLRELPLEARRARLQALVARVARPDRLRLSPRVEHGAWSDLAAARAQSRQRGAEGLMLKRRDSSYQVGRKRGDWWKWKVEPYTIDAVLTAARRGSGKRASLYTDYTFSVWDGDRLVPIAQAYSGLTDAEILQVDAWIRRHMVEKFGPVRTVEPGLVFELAFENIQRSTRHKSGIAVRFPRILRWRHDRTARDADTLEAIQRMLRQQNEAGDSGT